MLCAFGKHAFEAKLNKLRSDVVEVNELCIAYNLGLDAKTVAENRSRGSNLGGKFLGVNERRQTVRERLGDELDTSCFVQTV